MSKRSEKEARNNNELISQLFPVLAVTALLSYFQYRKLKKQYLANPQAKRIDVLMAHTPILVVATLGILLVLSGVGAAQASAPVQGPPRRTGGVPLLTRVASRERGKARSDSGGVTSSAGCSARQRWARSWGSTRRRRSRASWC